MSLLRAFLLSSLGLGCAWAQFTSPPRPPDATAAKYEVSGVVINTVTGEPVPRALVTLQTGNGQNAAFSDGSGHFALQDVPEGMYGITCQKPGFSGPASMNVPFQQINVSAKTEPVTIKLSPLGSITGRVVDEAGLPVDGVQVQLLSQNINSGRKRWMPSQSGSTDEDGNYEISGLPPDSYRLRLNMHPAPAFATATPLPRSRLPLNVYPTQYYPHGPDPAEAQAIVLQGGQTEHADFTVSAVPGFRLRGTIAPFSAGTFVRVEDPSGNDVGANASPDMRTGRFVVRALPAGPWRLVGQSFASNEQLWGEQDVTVSGSDLNNLALHLEPISAIPVKIENAPEGAAPGLQLRLVREESSMDGAGWNQNEYSAFAKASPGSEKAPELRFDNVLPGHYALRTNSMQGNFCLDSVRSGSSDVERDGITVTPGQAVQPIIVSLRGDCASLQIKTNAPDRQRITSILVISDNPLFESFIMGIQGSTPFSLSGLAPGHYRVYAFDDANGLEYANPQVMSTFPVTELTLSPNQKAEATLDVIQRTGERSVGDGTR